MLAWVVIYRRHLQHPLRYVHLCASALSSPPPNVQTFPSVLLPSTSLPPHFLTSRSSCPPALAPSGLPTIALSPLAATLIDLPAGVANKRLTSRQNSLDATYKKQGWRQSEALFRLTVQLQLSTVNLLRPVLPRITGGHGSRRRFPARSILWVAI